MCDKPDLSQSTLMYDLAVTLAETIESLIDEAGLPASFAHKLLDDAIEGLPPETQVMIRYEAYRLWKLRGKEPRMLN